MPVNINYDGTIDIATGRHRKEISWKNRETLWSDLLIKLSNTQRTHETYKEYLAAKKTRQDELKDVGGFVGGYLQGGRRKNGNVLHRQLLTLDIDFATADTWTDFMLLYNSAACIYSTHKHSSDHPRYRLILPLNRSVMADEYVAIARRVAGTIGIDQFDHTTYQPARLMYWPSTSKDGEYVFDYQDGGWMDADEILSTYTNWRDSSEWPVSDREGTVVQHAIKKQGDPLEKPGIIGAFCRTYNIHEVIEKYLGDAYEPCDIENRYTFKEGSTAAGLIVYDDKFVYSHHGTDPVSGKLCNAFDLVRLHKFGLKDEDAKEGTANNKLPSFLAMQEFASKDPLVRKQVNVERLEDAKSDFQFDESEIEEVDNDWLGQLDVDKRGVPYNGIDNITLILLNDPQLKGRIAFDEFEQREIILKQLPWRTADKKYLKDSDVANLKHYIKVRYNITSTTVTMEDALKVLYEKNKINVVKDFLKTCKWDGEVRAERIFIDYLGAADNDYIKAVTRKSLVAAVARIFEPGVKFDNMLTLVGPQGKGKSTILNKLGGKWFSDSFNFHMLGNKEAYEQLQGAWLIEVGELTGLRKTDVEAAKSFLAKREDRYRVSYGRRIEHFSRQCVFFGSTNNDTFLRDVTGNRRFWPVKIMEQQPTLNVFTGLTNEIIKQIWAEAVDLYKYGESLHLPDEMIDEAVRIQEEHTERDERAGLVLEYLEKRLPENWDEMDIYQRRSFLQGEELGAEGKVLRTKVCAAEIWCEVFAGRQTDMTTQNTKFIHDVMQKELNWKKSKSSLKFKGYGEQRGYVRSFSREHNESSVFAQNLAREHKRTQANTYK
jgi:putative DNA primase/helicase